MFNEEKGFEKLNENNPFSFKYIKGVYAYYNQVNFL